MVMLPVGRLQIGLQLLGPRRKNHGEAMISAAACPSGV